MPSRWLRGGIQLDLKSLRVRGLLVLASVSLALGALWIATSWSATSRARERAASARALALASTLARALESEGLLDDPAASSRISRLVAAVSKGLTLESPLRLLQVEDSLSTVIADADELVHPGALRTIVSSQADDSRPALDYRPEMAPTLFEARDTVVSHPERSAVVAYAPVRDEWNHTRAIVYVEEAAAPSLWRRLLELLLRGLGALSLIVLVLAVFELLLRRHCATLRELSTGFAEHVLERRFVSNEVRALAGAFVALRPLAVSASQPEDAEDLPRETAPVRRLKLKSGARELFHTTDLLERAAQPFRARAAEKRVEITTSVGERVPSEICGNGRAILAALNPLLENAVRFTRRGTIQLRIARVLESFLFRFEVADSGVGVAWQVQPSLDEVIRAAADSDPRDHSGGLGRVSAIAAKLGGELGFESQPGAGSRFWFTAQCESAESAASQPLRLHRAEQKVPARG